MSLCRLSWNARVACDAGALDDSYLLWLPLRGTAEYWHGSSSFCSTQNQAGIVGGRELFRVKTSEDFEPAILRISRSAVEHAWTVLSGESPGRPIRFSSAIPTNGLVWRKLEPMLKMVGSIACRIDAQPELPRFEEQIQDMLLTMLLLTQPHSAARPNVVEKKVSLAKVRRVQAYLLERLEDSLTLSGIAAAVDLPSRTLQCAFKSHEGMGPMQWLRQQRLLAVRAELLSCEDGSPRVAAAALKFGFAHLGEFSMSYRRLFGQSPSQTLSQRR